MQIAKVESAAAWHAEDATGATRRDDMCEWPGWQRRRGAHAPSSFERALEQTERALHLDAALRELAHLRRQRDKGSHISRVRQTALP
eukprot:3469034-Pleurochrysis_carterae.AAC.3